MKLYGRIVKIGGWTKSGIVDGNWHIEDAPDLTAMQTTVILWLEADGGVYVNGVEIVPWTEARLKAMREE